MSVPVGQHVHMYVPSACKPQYPLARIIVGVVLRVCGLACLRLHACKPNLTSVKVRFGMSPATDNVAPRVDALCGLQGIGCKCSPSSVASDWHTVHP
eukprot:13168540-Alexandrium_andersonii.AAC.1